MEERTRTRIICYGSMKEREQEIEADFDWQVIANASDRFKNSKNNDRVFNTIDEMGDWGNIVLYGKDILIHGSGHAFTIIEAVLSEAVGSYYKCAASVHYGGTMPCDVMLYESESQLLRVELSVGDLVEFGSFPQTAIGESQPIAWRVLEISGDGVLLMSRKALMKSDYRNTAVGQITPWHMMWGNSMARMYCNGYFYDAAFTEEQKNAIIPQPVEEAHLGPRCTDAVFIPSKNQLLSWITDSEERCARPTDYLKNPNNNVFVQNENTAWWILPSEKDGQPDCLWVDPKGEVKTPEKESFMARGAIRPCIRLRFDQKTLELLHRPDSVCMGKDSLYKTKDEVSAFCEMIGERVGEVLYHKRPYLNITLRDCEDLLSKLTADYGFLISVKQIEEFFIRHGILTRKPYTNSQNSGEGRLVAQDIFANLKYGPGLLPSYRHKMAAVLPELYRETLIKVDSEDPEFLRIPLGFDDTVWLIRRQRSGVMWPEFSLEIIYMKNIPGGSNVNPRMVRGLGTLYDRYSFTESDAQNLALALQRTCGFGMNKMAVLLTRYLDERRGRKKFISGDLDRLFEEAGIKPKQTRFWIDNQTAAKRYIPMCQTPKMEVSLSDTITVGDQIIEKLKNMDRFKTKRSVMDAFRQGDITINDEKVEDPESIGNVHDGDTLKIRGQVKFIITM